MLCHADITLRHTCCCYVIAMARWHAAYATYDAMLISPAHIITLLPLPPRLADDYIAADIATPAYAITPMLPPLLPLSPVILMLMPHAIATLFHAIDIAIGCCHSAFTG